MQELTALLRSMGQNPTDSEVQHMINQVDIDGSGAVDFDEFCHFMVKLMKNLDPENEAKEAYRSGTIPTGCVVPTPDLEPFLVQHLDLRT